MGVVNKPSFDWTEEDLRKVKIGFKVKHFMIKDLSLKVFYYAFTCVYQESVVHFMEYLQVTSRKE